MAEYINKEFACSEVDKGDLLVGNNAEWAKEIIRRTPTADVVEVVRCKVCEYGNMHTDCHGRKYYGCDLNIDIGEVREVEPTHYCGYGERKEGAE